MSDLRGRLRRLVRRGPRDVLYAHAATNGGNHLYLWMLAHTLRRANPQTYVQVVPSQAPWVAEFPALAELCLPGRMHVTDRRIARLGAGFDSDFTRSDLTDFTRARLLSSPSFTDRRAAAREVVTPGTLTVNVRRGDYYGTVHEAEFGIRIVPYVAAALALQAARAPLGHVQVVSDDLPWCQANLAPTLDEAGVSPAQVAELQGLIDSGRINDKLARQALEGVLAGEGDPTQVVEARGLEVVSDDGALTAAVQEALDANPDIVEKIKGGKVQAAGALVGAVMKATRGQADAARVRELIMEMVGA